jgi:hypothetical protein
MNISMKLCFVSVNGPRETYFVDAPRIQRKIEVSPIGEGPHVAPFQKQRTLEPGN